MTARLAVALYSLSLLFAAALIAKGYDSVGDGFSGGAVAGLGAALQYVCLPHAEAHARVGAALAGRLVALGLVAAVALLLLPTWFGLAPVSHFPRPGAAVLELGAVKLHTALVYDLAVAAAVYGTLVVTFDRLFPPGSDRR